MKLGRDEAMADKRHYVYRHYDAAGRLLYVGCTSLPKTRPYQHKTKPWWPEVARTVFSSPLSYAAGQSVEFAAIRNERPLHNRRQWGRTRERVLWDIQLQRDHRLAKEAGVGLGIVIHRMAETGESFDDALANLTVQAKEQS